MALIEICVDSIESINAALEGGADRIELCAALSEGGLTPSYGLIKYAVAVSAGKMKVNVLIRCRRGDFLYTPQEIEVMCNDIAESCRIGVDGIVVGALTADGDIDENACRQFLAAKSHGVTATFHRAFDVCRNPERALEILKEMNFDIILTSGCKKSAMEGCDNIKKFNDIVKEKLVILAGGGVTTENASEIIKSTGVKQVHGSLRKIVTSKMKFHREDVNMGNDADEYSIAVADKEVIKKLKNSVREL